MALKDDTNSLLEILSERLIKPASSTPPALRCHKLSQKDQMMDSLHVPMAFFYAAAHDTVLDGKDIINRSSSIAEISQLLRTSLSKTLTYYYPFAGRFVNNYFVDCNDAGVEYTEARIKCSMSEILKQENSDLRDHVVFPGCYFSVINPTESSPVILQASFFNCGGIAVAVCPSHKLLDACTTCNFMNDWAAIAREISSSDGHDNDNDNVVLLQAPPLFNVGPSLFPPLENDSCKNELRVAPPRNQENCISRRFLFQKSKIDELKAMAVEIQNPTRYEVLTALLFRSAKAAASEADSGSFKPSSLINVANMRSLTNPPLPTNSTGNFFTGFIISATTKSQMEFPELVSQLRKAKLKLHEEHKNNKTTGDATSTNGIIFDPSYICTSVFSFPFYRVDFGFGKPVLVSHTNEIGLKNTFRLMGTREGDSIEAIVTLDASAMSFFQANHELLAFATLMH